MTSEQRVPLLEQQDPPGQVDALAGFADKSKGTLATQAAQGHISRIREWKGRVRQAWKACPSEVYKRVRKPAPGRTFFLRRSDGALTGNWAEMQELAQEAWTPEVFCKEGRPKVHV